MRCGVSQKPHGNSATSSCGNGMEFGKAKPAAGSAGVSQCQTVVTRVAKDFFLVLS